MRRSVHIMEETYAGLVDFHILNVDHQSTHPLAIEHQVSAIPLIVLLDAEGNVVERIEGFQTEEQLAAALDDLIKEADG